MFCGDEKRAENIVKNLRMIWISHHHLDHHIGLWRLIEIRNSFRSTLPILIVGPSSIGDFLSSSKAWSSSRETLRYRYFDVRQFNNLGTVARAREIMSEWISDIVSVPVYHCCDAWGVVLTLRTNQRVVYSGDTRPCQNLVRAGFRADLLIHEATFADDEMTHAMRKKHSTFGEALRIGAAMQARWILTTHFSSRYGLPDVGNEIDVKSLRNVMIAFDLMKIRLWPLGSAMPTVSILYPAMRHLFQDHRRSSRLKDVNVLFGSDDDEDDGDSEKDGSMARRV